MTRRNNAAAQASPDVCVCACAEVRILQTGTPKAHISDLFEANRVLLETKKAVESLMVQFQFRNPKLPFVFLVTHLFETKKGSAILAGDHYLCYQ